MKKTIKKSLVGGLVFSLTAVGVFVVYATNIGSTWTNPDDIIASSGAKLTSDSWNKMLANFNDLNDRVNSISSNPNLIKEIIVSNCSSSGKTECVGLGSPQTDINISGLNINNDGGYLIEMGIIGNANSEIILYTDTGNGILDTINTDYTIVYHGRIGSTGVQGTVNKGDITGVNSTNNRTLANMNIYLLGDKITWNSFDQRYNLGESYYINGQKTTGTATNLTKIQLHSNSGVASFGVGSFVRIYKKK